jgi:hypothetical protein
VLLAHADLCPGVTLCGGGVRARVALSCQIVK